MSKLFRATVIACATLLAGVTAFAGKTSAKEPDYSNLTAANHPRIVYTDEDFAAIATIVGTGENPYLDKMHKRIMQEAEKFIGAADIERVFAGKRVLYGFQKGVRRILYCAYAYKVTGEKKFLEQAEHDIKTACKFEDWNAVRHFLDAGEMSAAIGLGYDWLYNDLSDKTKALARKALNDFAFYPALEKNPSFYRNTNNWNSVCNGGLVCAALATYEDNPDTSKEIIEKAFATNGGAMKAGYSPDGNYPEGYMYWNYGTMYESLLLTALETALGSDNGLSDVEGFSKTGKYMIFMEGPSGLPYNYSDCENRIAMCLPQWYLAWKFGDLSVLYLEKDKKITSERLLPVFAWLASKVSVKDIAAPKEKIFHGEGITPIVLIHDNWEEGSNGKFLGIKAGKPRTSHSHMDGGSFVYDADGIRWAFDLGRQKYVPLETQIDLWNMKDGSERWTAFRYNNFNHNTLTVNGAYHKVEGVTKILEVIDSNGRKGAKVDITEPLGDDVAEAIRTIYMEGDDLVVEDRITALDGRPAHVRWTMVTPARPTVAEGGVILRQGNKMRCLTYSSSTGHKVEWKTWSAQSTNSFDEPNSGLYECGYTTTVARGETAVITIRLSPDIFD